MPTACPWTDRVWREFHAHNFTRGERDAVLTLRTYRGQGGLICPSQETLAERARCSVSTVQRALKQAEHLGLLTWRERRRWVGWRWLRTSNAYSLLLPEVPVIGGLRRVRSRSPSTGQKAGGGETQIKERARSVAEQLAMLGVSVPVGAGSPVFKAAMGW